jgi:pimeloyl-ACP methyl ester carboxylesterase
MEQRVRYCVTPDGVRIAYAVVGSGPPFVWISGWLSHLELDWNSSVRRRSLELMGSRVTLVRHDKRGTGLSSWRVGDYTLDASVRDVEALVDHLGLDRFAMGGLSEGGPTAILYAARHPDRVTKLVLYGCYAHGDGIMGSPEMRDAVRLVISTQWGFASKLMSAIFLGDDSYITPEQFAAGQLASAPAEDALALLERAINVDVRAALSSVAAPTLVFHHRDDMAVPIELGQELAAGIPNARFLSGPGGHYPTAQGWMDFTRATLSFLLDQEIDDLGRYRIDDTAAEVVGVPDASPASSLPAMPLFDDGSLVIDTESHQVTLNGRPIELAPTEFRLLVALASAPGRVQAYDELLHRVWGAEYVGETDFLHVYVSRLRRKLGRDAIATERGFGYRFVGASGLPHRSR